MLKALVYGWYGKDIKNIGDVLFCQAFKILFPYIEFTFTNHINKDNLKDTDAVFFGGGSFLYAPINTDCFDSLLTKTIFYIGVGIETDIHPMHEKLFFIAKLIATRSHAINNRFIQLPIIKIPDIVYALSNDICISNEVVKDSILVIPNCELIPKWNDIHWKHAAWSYFKSQLAQMLDMMKEQKYKIFFAPMCLNNNMSDMAAAYEIIGNMTHRNFDNQLDFTKEFSNLHFITQEMSKYQYVISQRYHGSVLAYMCGKPCLTISHHDKLNNINIDNSSISYYEISKHKLLKEFNLIKNQTILPIKLDKFEMLRNAVSVILEG